VASRNSCYPYKQIGMSLFALSQSFHVGRRLVISLLLACCCLSASELSVFGAYADPQPQVTAIEFRGYFPFKERLGADRRPTVVRGKLAERDLFSSAAGTGSFEFRFDTPDPYEYTPRAPFRSQFRPLRGLPFRICGRAPPCFG